MTRWLSDYPLASCKFGPYSPMWLQFQNKSTHQKTGLRECFRICLTCCFRIVLTDHLLFSGVAKTSALQKNRLAIRTSFPGLRAGEFWHEVLNRPDFVCSTGPQTLWRMCQVRTISAHTFLFPLSFPWQPFPFKWACWYFIWAGARLRQTATLPFPPSVQKGSYVTDDNRIRAIKSPSLEKDL